jgi:hypothetical protein
MFRRGGSTNTGIMSGLVDRKNYKFGSMTEDEIRSNVELLRGLQEQFAPLPKTRLPLGEVGLALASGAPIIDALGVGYKKFVSEDDKRRALAAKRDQAAVSTVLGQALKTPKDARTAAIKNAMAMGLKPGTKEFNEYVTAATIKGGGLNIEFDDQGNIKSITEGKKSRDPNEPQILQIQNTAFQLNNAGSTLIKQLKGAKVGPVGAFINALDSAGAQISQAANAFGFTKDYEDTGSGDIDNYLTNKFGSELAGDAVKFGKVKSASIQLAYLMAKADEPGGRFTDRDIALKMQEIGLGANPEKTIAILTDSINTRNKNLNYGYGLLTGGKTLDFSKMDAVGEFALGFKDKETKSESDVGLPEYKFINGVLHVKKGDKFEPVKAK